MPKNRISTESAGWLLALGVVFGDIGTSPLYAFQATVNLVGAGFAVQAGSLIIWTVFLVVGMKYAFVMMRETYQGEGGVFALYSLLKKTESRFAKGIMATVAIFGAALLLGDGALTPAISVLSAVQGMATVHPSLAPLTLRVTVLVLVGLFLVQRFGTGSLGSVFGPVMLLWFLAIAVMGVLQIVVHPEVLAAFNPLEGVELLRHSGSHAMVIIGAVALAVTGAEALYADLSQFGRTSILRAWRFVAFPALILNYLGQAAFVIGKPSTFSDPSLFFLLCPNVEWRGVLVLLATAATVIASQALISAVFTLVKQARSLGFLPAFATRHTSPVEIGQIYIPTVNLLLGATSVFLVIAFRSSSSLANAYGISVTGAMAVTSLIWGAVKFSTPGEPRWRNGAILLFLLALDFLLFLSCMTKLLDGGYVPFIISILAMAIMVSWYRGNNLVSKVMKVESVNPDQLGHDLETNGCLRVDGTGIFMTHHSTPEYAVGSILETKRCVKALPRNLVILMLDSKWSDPNKVLGEVSIERHSGGLWEVRVPHGYMVEADAPASMRAAAEASGGELKFDIDDSFFVTARNYISKCPSALMPMWQRKIFSFLSRNVGIHINILNIPPGRLVIYTHVLEIDPKILS